MKNTETSKWTPEQIGVLTGHVTAGLTCNQIAKQMGLTKSGVIGKIHRLGLKLNTPPEPTWEADSVAALKMAIQEGLGIAATSRRLGKSTNSCRAKAGRLGLTFGKAAGVPIPRAPAPDKVVIPMPIAAPQEPAGPSSGYSLIDLPAKGCKFPLDLASADVMMCGKPRGEDPAYCPGCRARASYPRTKSPNQQMRGLRRYITQ